MENNGKGIFYGVIGVATLIVAIIGATFAYFTATASNNAVTGTAAQAGLELKVEQTSTGTGDMVPQLTSTIASAVTGTGEKSCVDGNGNTVCKVYSVTLTNTGSSAVTVSGTIAFTGGTFANLKWGKADAATGFTAANSAYAASGATPVTDIVNPAKTDTNAAVTTLQAAGGAEGSNSMSFYIIVYINEINEKQDETDTGTFTGTITFNSASADGTSTSGLTSTFKA